MPNNISYNSPLLSRFERDINNADRLLQESWYFAIFNSSKLLHQEVIAKFRETAEETKLAQNDTPILLALHTYEHQKSLGWMSNIREVFEKLSCDIKRKLIEPKTSSSKIKNLELEIKEMKNIITSIENKLLSTETQYSAITQSPNYPDYMICPISQKIMTEPYICSSDEVTYERARIVKYAKENNNMTPSFKPMGELIPNRAIKESIEYFIKNNSASSSSSSSTKTPDYMICPISYQIMREPYICSSDGVTYEREKIVEWIEQAKKTPFHQPAGELIPNRALEKNINSFINNILTSSSSSNSTTSKMSTARNQRTIFNKPEMSGKGKEKDITEMPSPTIGGSYKTTGSIPSLKN